MDVVIKSGVQIPRCLQAQRKQAAWVHIKEWTPVHIGIGVYATFESNGITFNISPNRRVEIPVAVVVQPGFPVEVLARKTQVVG